MKQLAYFIIGLGIGFLACKFLFQTEDTKGDIEVVVTKPKGVITPAKAKELDRNFDRKHALINKDLGIEDNRSSWYSLKDMRDYLVYAENQANDLKYNMDGVRVYLGSHADDGLTTMFLVPTGIPFKSATTNNFLPPSSGDIPDGDVLNNGGDGVPPSHHYPQ